MSFLRKLIKKKGKKAPAKPLPQATRDEARDLAMRDEELARRRGGAADLLLGLGGAEPGGASLGRFVLGS